MEKSGKIAVIGDKDSVELFSTAGADVFSAQTEFEAIDALKKTVKESYAVVFVTEDIAAMIPKHIENLKIVPFPVVIPIPSASGSNGFGMEGILKNVEKAVGVRDIL